MKFDSLREFIDVIGGLGELKQVDHADWNLEIGALTELVAEKRGPALLFDHIKDYPAGYRVLTNPFTTLRRTALVHGLSTELTALEMLKAWRDKLREFKPVPVVQVPRGSVKENIILSKEVDLLKLPAPLWHEVDGGRYLGTGCCVITRERDKGWVNLGTYRCMPQGKDRLSICTNRGKHARMMMDQYHAKGESCPVAVVLGEDPALFAAASDMSVPWGVSEYEFAGWLRGAPIEVVKGEVTDLPIPATAEIVVEGEVPPPPFEPLVEGPCGEWTGYAADASSGILPVMKVKSVLHRNDPIILGLPPMKPPIPYDFAMPRWAVAVWEQVERAGVPIQGVWFMSGFLAPAIIVIAVKQQYSGHAKQAAVVASACRAGTQGSRIIIVVDEDVNITDAEEVMWAVATRSRAEDVDIVRGLWTSTADPMIDKADRQASNFINSKLIINACRPWERRDDFPPVNRVSPAYRGQILEKWSELLRSI
ncbi:MAG: UbiD family decarboxylase [Chloroflexota bacterium]